MIDTKIFQNHCAEPLFLRDQLRDDFQESVEMSTYLVAFVVCDFQRVSTQTARHVSVSVYAPDDLIAQAGFALRTAADIMDYYEEFFGVPYPLPKQGTALSSSLRYVNCGLA